MSDDKERPTTPPRPQPDEIIPFRRRDERIGDDIHESEWEPPRDEDVPLDREESD